MHIDLFITWGTVDKAYNELTGRFTFGETRIPTLLALWRNSLDVRIQKLMMIDSLDMTDDHRELIAQHCILSSADKILITHGTDTMPQTAARLAKKSINKTICLTWAMIPYRFGESDGMFNIASALAFVQVLTPNVYVCMNGTYFTRDNVQKNKQKWIFETVD